MSPVPCHHCGYHFMRSSVDPEEPRLCNNCIVREDLRNPKKGSQMLEDTINILIKCPKDIHKDVEEHCINKGIDLTRYFLNLHRFYLENFHEGDQILFEKVEEIKPIKKEKKK